MGFLKIDHKIYDTNFYKWVLSPYDREAIQGLWRIVLTGNNKYYDNGLLVVNALLKTTALTAGMKYSTLKDSISRLDYLGAIIKLPKTGRNNKFLVGFRSLGNERIYLLDHLVDKYENWLKETINNQLEELPKRWQTPAINDLTPYRIKKDYRDFICDYINKPNILINRRLLDGKTLFELLFNRKDIYRPTLKSKVLP